MQERYEPRSIESKAQSFWESRRSFRVTEDDSRQKFYCLSMFPYPPAAAHGPRQELHHRRRAHAHRMRGMNVLQPMGWDAFGLPAENAAMANKMPPAKWTLRQHREHEEAAAGPRFRHRLGTRTGDLRSRLLQWNQWLFARPVRKGLAYKKTGVVNWDPVDQTVLANEQVIDGRGWRPARRWKNAKSRCILPHHRISGRVALCARRHQRMAHAGQADAKELDRQVGRRRIGFPYELGERRRRRFGSSPRVPTRSWERPSAPWRLNIPSLPGLPKKILK